MTGSVKIGRWIDREDQAAVARAVEDIFWETSAISASATGAERAAFRERWLRRYFAHDPSFVYVATLTNGAVAGYLVGCLDDAASDSRFDDLAYFQMFAPLTREYPAHLHVNLTASCRGQGVGALLVERFANDAALAGARGVHVVTGQGMRNVGFYVRNGFREIAATEWNGKVVLFLGRKL